ncbi:MAG: hypothetical protein JWO67_6948, partial [Streptosporangiaceae bacterium]|nr:hypothetical protein [Streptosporangiaceae bacterium]
MILQGESIEAGRPKGPMAMERKRIPNWLWALAGVATVGLVLFVLWWGPWLFTRYPNHALTSDQKLKAVNDVRTTLVQAVGGLVVAAGLIVTYRTFRQNQRAEADRRDEQDRTYQLSLQDQEKRWAEQDRAYQLNLAAQVTDTYTKAVEQLGHTEAPVRLGALYSLASVAEDNPPRRQNVADVLCAYLRMPYTPPKHDSVESLPLAADQERERNAAQELQVRQTAQRLLADHLRRSPNVSGEDAQRIKASPEETFWPGISLDLTGATLVDLSMVGTSVIEARFTKAIFSGDAFFGGAAFSRFAVFDGAAFSGIAVFDGAAFSDGAFFGGAAFSGGASFGGAAFSRFAVFDEAAFSGIAVFNGAAFSGGAGFARATFSSGASFDRATFSSGASFDRATFSGDARFDGAAFSDGASFDRA